MGKLEEYKARAIARHGAARCDFSEIDAADKSVKEAYELGIRVKVQTHGQVESGYIGLTTGWAPGFILVYNARSLGGELLSRESIVLGPSNARRPCKARR